MNLNQDNIEKLIKNLGKETTVLLMEAYKNGCRYSYQMMNEQHERTMKHFDQLIESIKNHKEKDKP